MKRWIHQDKLIEDKFVKVNKLLLENPKYAKLSDGAILTYSILRDRLDLSEQNSETYTDENGYVYIIYTDKELAEILHRTTPTANARKKELEKAGLLEMVKGGYQQPNRIYLCEPERCATEEYITNVFRKKRAEEKEKKRKESYEKPKSENIVSPTKKEKKTPETVGAQQESKFLIPSNQKFLSLGIKNFDAINTYLSKTDLSETEIQDILSIVNYQEAQMNGNKPSPEEPKNENVVLTADEFEKEYTDVCNSFYAEFSPGRWNKATWNKLIRIHVSEMIESERYLNVTRKSMDGYAFVSISNMAKHSDYKKSDEYKEYLAVLDEMRQGETTLEEMYSHLDELIARRNNE